MFRVRVLGFGSLKGSIRASIGFLSGYLKCSSLNYGPFRGPLFSGCRAILRTQKGAPVWIAIHIEA